MSTTRKAQPGAALSQERYMSSAEMAEKEGLKGLPVAAKAALYSDARKRSLLFFLQAMSTRQGGLEKVAADVIEMFPERLGSSTMHRLGIKPGSQYRAEDAEAIQCELTTRDERLCALFDKTVGRHEAKSNGGAKVPARALVEKCQSMAVSHLAGFLWEFCLNPRVAIVLQGENHRGCTHGNSQSVPEHWNSEAASPSYFQDIAGALLEYKSRHEQQARNRLAETVVSKLLFRTLDRGLRSRKIVVAQGIEGIGKSFSAEAWCECHLGEAVFVRLDGIVTKTTFFQVVSKALGLAGSVSQKSQEMQIRIRHHLERSGLMLVIDEAHRLFQQTERIYSHPELLNWIYTLWDYKIPVALLCTPQFVSRMDEVERQTDWRSGQLKRRIELWTTLPSKLSEAELHAVACNIAPGFSENMRQELVDFASTGRRQIDSMQRAISAASFIAEEHGRKAPGVSDLRAGIEEAQQTDAALTTPLDAERLNNSTHGRRKGRRGSTSAALLQAACNGSEIGIDRAADSDLSRAVQPASASRSRQLDSALA